MAAKAREREPLVLVEAEWYAIENPDQPGGGFPYYRHCDICYDGADSDAMAGRMIEEFRRFWQELPSRLIICEKCLDNYLLEKPESNGEAE